MRSSRARAEIKAAEFKAKCLELMDDVARTGNSIVITKRGVPVARLVPATEHAISPFGFAKGTFEEMGDIVAPLSPAWQPNEHELALIDPTRGSKRRGKSSR